MKFIKDNINRIFLKAPTSKQFINKMNELNKNFHILIEKNFNETINKLDNLINSIIKLKNKYIEEYLKQIEYNIKTFEIIKIFYMNYFIDKESEMKKINIETNNIYKLKYISNISHEFEDLKLEYLPTLDMEIEKITQKIKEIKIPKIKLFSSEYLFQQISKDYILDEIIPAHSKFISSLTSIDTKIISGSVDYTMKLWDNESGVYKIIQSVKTKQVINLLSLKKRKISLNSLNNKDI